MVWAWTGRSSREWRYQSTVDINIQCANLIQARRPDLIVLDKKEQKGIIIDIAVPADVRVEKKEKEKVEKYQDLKNEIRRLWNLRNVEIVLAVIGALESVSAEFDRWMWKLGIQCWNDAKVCLGGNCKNTEKIIGNVKTRVFC